VNDNQNGQHYERLHLSDSQSQLPGFLSYWVCEVRSRSWSRLFSIIMDNDKERQIERIERRVWAHSAVRSISIAAPLCRSALFSVVFFYFNPRCRCSSSSSRMQTQRIPLAIRMYLVSTIDMPTGWLPGCLAACLANLARYDPKAGLYCSFHFARWQPTMSGYKAPSLRLSLLVSVFLHSPLLAPAWQAH